LTGEFGCGKTHLAAAIANHQILVRRSLPLFVLVPDLLDHLRATFSPTSTTTLDRLFEQVKNASLLVLDDLGTESATPWAREKLFGLLNHRYVARLPTVITINDLNNTDARLISRISDTRGTVFRIDAPSYRGDEARTTAKAVKAGARGRSASG
jgi:DNA replication protein DnaC